MSRSFVRTRTAAYGNTLIHHMLHNGRENTTITALTEIRRGSSNVETTGCSSDFASTAPHNQETQKRSVLERSNPHCGDPQRSTTDVQQMINQEALHDKHTGKKNQENTQKALSDVLLEKHIL